MRKSEEMPFDGYVQTVLARLSQLTPAQRSEIQAELEAHLADAADERGCRPDDLVLQAAVIAELGSAKRLGKDWAQAYCSTEGRMRGSTMVVFWVLWVLASIVGWGFQGSYDETSIWQAPLSPMVAIAFQSLLLRGVAGVQWWRSWLMVSLVPWVVVLTGMYTDVPWGIVTEYTIISTLLLIGVALGIGQWLVLRRHVNLAWLWIIVPPMSLVAAFRTSISVNLDLIAQPDVVGRLGGWQEAHMLVGAVLGATDGIVTGTILLVLMSLPAFRRSQRLA